MFRSRADMPFQFCKDGYLPFGKYSRYSKAWQIINRLSKSEFYIFDLYKVVRRLQYEAIPNKPKL